MDTINKNDFIDIYVLKTINEIKNSVTRNINLNKEREEEIDKKMYLVLKDLINPNFKNLQIDPKGNMIYTFLPIIDENENAKVRLSLVLYYTALYYDNVDLLNDLLREDISFNYYGSINLQYLDKSISSKFERKKYIEMIKTCGYIFKNFVRSIKKLSEQEKEIYINRFVKLITTKYDLICEVLSKKNDYCSNEKLEYIFEKENLDTFTDETYDKATEKQLNLINRCQAKRYSKETCDRLNNLMQKKDFSNFLCNFDLMMRLYTDEQLETLDYDISFALDSFSENDESLNKISDFLQRRPDLARNIVCISKEKFMKIDNFTLIELSDNVYPIYFRDINFDLITRITRIKVTLKKVFGAYNKKDTQKQNIPKLVKKMTPPKQ